MTNFASIAGGFVWTAVATVLMFAALEPALDDKAAAPVVVLAAAPTAGAAS